METGTILDIVQLLQDRRGGQAGREGGRERITFLVDRPIEALSDCDRNRISVVGWCVSARDAGPSVLQSPIRISMECTHTYLIHDPCTGVQWHADIYFVGHAVVVKQLSPFPPSPLS